MTELPKPAQEKLVDQVVKQFTADRRWSLVKRIGLALMVGLSVITLLWGFVEKVGRWPVFGNYIAVVSIKGDIEDGARSSADQVIPALRRAFDDSSAKSIILEIDSGGGSPLEAERIYCEIDRLRAKYPKPVVAVINTIGASAAYMIAVHADRIIAGRYSLVGSIGTKASRYDLHGLAERFDIRQDTYASGPLKDMFNPLSKPTEAERVKAQAMVSALAKAFEADVRLRRGAKLQAGNITSGEVWTGEEALQMGLIDQLATIDTLAAEKGLQLSYLGPAVRPTIFGSFQEAISAGVERGVRSLARQSIEVR